MRKDYKSKKLLYHFTALDNLENILRRGLLPRNQLQEFLDVADPDILSNRARFGLDGMVPFHFFSNNPFDGRVWLDRPQTSFIYITVDRRYAQRKGWLISARHPLNGHFNLLNYEEGIEKIDWEAMGERRYKDDYCRSVCMAECLSPSLVTAQEFHSIFVVDERDARWVRALLSDFKVHISVKVNHLMFSKKRNG